MNKSLLQQIKSIASEIESGREVESSRIEGILHSLSDSSHIIRCFPELPDAYVPATVALLSGVYDLLTPKEREAVELSVVRSAEGLRLVIRAQGAAADAVDEHLEQFGAALRQDIPLNELVNDKEALMRLKQRLDLVALELSIAAGDDGSAQDEAAIMQQIEAQGKEVERFFNAMGEGLRAVTQLRLLIIKRLKDTSDTKERQVFEHLVKLLDGQHKDLKASFQALKKDAPDLFEQLKDLINRGSESGKAGDYLYGWIASIVNILPK
jgi:hypothetical protein